MTPESLPPIVEDLARAYPALWEAYNRLGQAAAEAGPLDEKTERLVKLAIAVGAGREGAVHSHVRRGRGAGLTRDELRHVALLAITTIGWPAAIAALTWIEDAMKAVPGGTGGGCSEPGAPHD
jgi:alkylhydroperoxidase/carboxymuconolactone decarboxylase family protein YurZ